MLDRAIGTEAYLSVALEFRGGDLLLGRDRVRGGPSSDSRAIVVSSGLRRERRAGKSLVKPTQQGIPSLDASDHYPAVPRKGRVSWSHGKVRLQWNGQGKGVSSTGSWSPIANDSYKIYSYGCRRRLRSYRRRETRRQHQATKAHVPVRRQMRMNLLPTARAHTLNEIATLNTALLRLWWILGSSRDRRYGRSLRAVHWEAWVVAGRACSGKAMRRAAAHTLHVLRARRRRRQMPQRRCRRVRSARQQ